LAASQLGFYPRSGVLDRSEHVFAGHSELAARLGGTLMAPDKRQQYFYNNLQITPISG